MLSGVKGVRRDNILTVKTNDQIRGVSISNKPVFIFAVSPCVPAVFDSHPPGRPKLKADILLSRFADLNFSDSFNREIFPHSGATHHQKDCQQYNSCFCQTLKP